ncbi:DUF1289 domain-containing protein [Gilliamella sp. wkB112]|uniref:DUF1289 domain-containing protein n=1 Tax=Gilliamella sp. wkB112 TaxID=3120257 RepID=UPI00080DF0CB|nr:DUF1289 domain-containing protein [Gilliamella apicola]OCG00825.1 hypothetical protein A9G12_03415 [Gilliamella apicola]
MDQLEFFAIPSPCQGICQSNKQGYCFKCFRSRAERFNWFSFSDAQKQQILRLCKQRRLRHHYLLWQQHKRSFTPVLQQGKFNF